MNIEKTPIDPSILKSHPAIPDNRESSLQKLLDLCGCELGDGEGKFWKNCGDTLVIAFPDLSKRSKDGEPPIREWINGYNDLLMEAVWELKPDEFDIQPLTGKNGFNRIARFWWD